jgi:hypothetical protein
MQELCCSCLPRHGVRVPSLNFPRYMSLVYWVVFILYASNLQVCIYLSRYANFFFVKAKKKKKINYFSWVLDERPGSSYQHLDVHHY